MLDIQVPRKAPISVDPRTVIFERVTNMWDALIEAEAQRRHDFACGTPTEAARKFFAEFSSQLHPPALPCPKGES